MGGIMSYYSETVSEGHIPAETWVVKLFDDVTALEAVFNLRRWSETRLVW